MTPEERKLWAHLRNRQVLQCKFRRQAAIGPYVVDFVCFERRLVVELDGSQHGFSDQRARDRARDAWLKSQGFRVLRVWNLDLRRNTDDVLTTICAALADKSGPLPLDGGAVGAAD